MLCLVRRSSNCHEFPLSPALRIFSDPCNGMLMKKLKVTTANQNRDTYLQPIRDTITVGNKRTYTLQVTLARSSPRFCEAQFASSNLFQQVKER